MPITAPGPGPLGETAELIATVLGTGRGLTVTRLLLPGGHVQGECRRLENGNIEVTGNVTPGPLTDEQIKEKLRVGNLNDRSAMTDEPDHPEHYANAGAHVATGGQITDMNGVQGVSVQTGTIMLPITADVACILSRALELWVRGAGPQRLYTLETQPGAADLASPIVHPLRGLILPDSSRRCEYAFNPDGSLTVREHRYLNKDVHTPEAANGFSAFTVGVGTLGLLKPLLFRVARSFICGELPRLAGLAE